MKDKLDGVELLDELWGVMSFYMDRDEFDSEVKPLLAPHFNKLLDTVDREVIGEDEKYPDFVSKELVKECVEKLGLYDNVEIAAIHKSNQSKATQRVALNKLRTK